jgi:TorA maturation chaperone TorD
VRLGEVACCRQLAYRLFSLVLLYPEAERVEHIVAAASELQRLSQAFVGFAFFPRWQSLLHSLSSLPGRDVLEEQYVRLFMHSPEKTPCLPYESANMDPTGRLAGWIPALVEREYAVEGLALSSSLSDLPDHISVELDFMASLCGKEADAWESEDVQEGLRMLGVEAGFLRRHLHPWVPSWSRHVAAVGRDGVYPVVAETVREFIAHDIDLADILRGRAEAMSGTGDSGCGDERWRPRDTRCLATREAIW